MINSVEQSLKDLSREKYPYSPVIGLARSCLALGLFLTLLFTPIEHIITSLQDGTLLNPLLNPLAPINEYNFFLIFGLEQAGAAKLVALGSLVLVMSGYLPQLTALLHWWIALSFMLASSAIDGGDQIHANLAFLLLPLCLTDPRLNHWQATRVENRKASPRNFFGILSIWLISLQMAVIYFHASVGKYEVAEWSNGTALYYWFYHSVFGMPAYLEGFTHFFLSRGLPVTLLTYGVLIVEIVLAGAIFMSARKRKFLLPLAIGFHFFIILYHGIFSFFFSVLAGLILYLGNPYSNLNGIKVIAKKLRKPKAAAHRNKVPA